MIPTVEIAQDLRVMSAGASNTESRAREPPEDERSS